MKFTTRLHEQHNSIPAKTTTNDSKYKPYLEKNKVLVTVICTWNGQKIYLAFSDYQSV
ncbi:9301_t:CDS:2 [Gigaspora margarita]|uniref:9301_t:CDS:1 n=1 Tax=Gigaspora margarita TaxID=4874 RepID=A0ABN7UJ04_GIGMA|nr:9301_t:CDS:2 [Gigaspora margarita]